MRVPAVCSRMGGARHRLDALSLRDKEQTEVIGLDDDGDEYDTVASV
ncbi:hypothetical protein [Streptomyces bicolor]|nr:hypothetical protein [Streptomyces bicolor]